MSDLKDVYPNTDIDIEKVKKIAEGHAEWFCSLLKPLLVSFSVHFFKHGYDEGREESHE